MNDRVLSSTRLLLLAYAGAWLLLTLAQIGYLPCARYAWGYNFWQYLPVEVAAPLAALSLILCFTAVRQRVAAVVHQIAALLMRTRPRGTGALFLLLVPALLWAVRERQLLGDSEIFVLTAATGTSFLFPDIGASFLIGHLYQLGNALGLDTHGCVSVIQAATCACGAIALFFSVRSAAYLAPSWQAPATALLFSGGLVRVFAGHVEVYAFILVAVAGYLWTALAALQGRVGVAIPGVVLGVAVWLHLSALCLVPSLLLLLLMAEQSPGASRSRAVIVTLVLVALPSALFFAGMVVAGRHSDLTQAFEVLREITGVSANPDAVHRWVRGWGGEPSHGTDYVFVSRAHLKYLANASHVLSPAALPILVVALMRRPSLFWLTPTARFLSVACTPLIAYALLLRPVWGPFDWDLFTIVAFFLTALAAHLLAQAPRNPPVTSEAQEIHTWLVGTSLLFVTIPFLLMARGPVRDAGPFAGQSFGVHILHPESPKNIPLLPWL